MRKRVALFLGLMMMASTAHASVTFLPSAKLHDQKELIASIEDYLSNLTSLKAEFTQTGPDGSIATGVFFLKRPGKMRWQYAPPSPLLLVSDGKAFTFYDKELEQVSHVSLDDTMLGFLARDTIRFDGAVGITQLEDKDQVLRVSLAQKEKPNEGSLTLEFTQKPLLLRNIIITDASQQITSVGLYNAKWGIELSDSIFVFHDTRKKR